MSTPKMVSGETTDGIHFPFNLDKLITEEAPPAPKYDRFDVEQCIMTAWGTGDDLSLILDHWDELSEDEKMNAIMGLIELHDMRCNKLFKAFEAALKR